MLRALIVLCVIGTVASSDSEMPSRRMPTAAEVAAAAASINQAIKQVSALSQDANFVEDMDNMRQTAKAVDRVSQPALGSLDPPSAVASAAPNRVFNSAKQLPRTLGRSETSLLAFVSLGMQDAQLQAIASEAKKLGARLLIRGLYRDDLTETLLRVKQLGIDDGISIDPTLFRLFSVTAVPTYVLTLEPIVAAKTAQPRHVTATGSVTLGYFLQRVVRTQPSSIARSAERWMDTSLR